MEKIEDKIPKTTNFTNIRQDINENRSVKFKTTDQYKNNNYRGNNKYKNWKNNSNHYNNNEWNDNYKSSNYNRYSWDRNRTLRRDGSRKRSHSPLKYTNKTTDYFSNNKSKNRHQRDKNDNTPKHLNNSRSHKQLAKSSKKNKRPSTTIKAGHSNLELNNFKISEESNDQQQNKLKISQKPVNLLELKVIDEKTYLEYKQNTSSSIKPITPSTKRKQNIFNIIQNNRKKNEENLKNDNLDNNITNLNSSENTLNHNTELQSFNLNTNIIAGTNIHDTVPKISLVPLSQLLREELLSHIDEITKKNNTVTNQSEQTTTLTDKLLNKVVKMDKINIKNIINNPSAKFDAALKLRASQRFRDEIRKQLRALQIENPDLNKCNDDFESDSFVNDNNIPQLILDQIQQSLGIEFLQEIANETTSTMSENIESNLIAIVNTEESSSAAENVIQPIIEETPSQILIESKVINQNTEEQNLTNLAKPDLLQKLKNLDSLKVPSKSPNTEITPEKHNNKNSIKPTSKLPTQKITCKSSPKVLNSNNNNNNKKSPISNNCNNRKKKPIKNSEILTIHSSSSSSSGSSSSSDSDSSTSSSSSGSSTNSTKTYKITHHRSNNHSKDKEILVVERFKKLILPTLSVYLRKKYNDKYSKNLTNSLSFIYDICLNKLMKNSNLGSYEKKVLKKNLKSNNNDGALEYLLKNIEELHEQNEKYKKKPSIIINKNNTEISTININNNINKKSIINELNPIKKPFEQNQISNKINLITNLRNHQNNTEQIDNSVIEAAVQNSEFIASQLKKIAQQKIDERNKEKLINIQQKQKNLQKLSSSSATTTPNIDTTNTNSISTIKNNNVINEEPKSIITTNDSNKKFDDDENQHRNLENTGNKKQLALDKPASSAGKHQSINKELMIEDDYNKFEVVKSNILPILSKYLNDNGSDSINDIATTNTNISNNKNLSMMEKNPIDKINPIKEIETNLMKNQNRNLCDNMIIPENNFEGDNYNTEEEEEDANNENSENPEHSDENNLNTDLLVNGKQRSWKSPGEKKCVLITSNNKIRHSEITSTSQANSSSASQNKNSTSEADENDKISTDINNLQMTALIQQNKISEAVINNLKELDLRLLELHKRKMYVEEMILKLQKDNMTIDLARMQLQNERFLIINSVLAKTNTSLTTNQLLSSINASQTSNLFDNILIKTEPSTDWLQSTTSLSNGLSVTDYVSSIFPSSNILSVNNLLASSTTDTSNKRKTIDNSIPKIPFSTAFSEKLRNRKKRCQSDILLEDTEKFLNNSQDNFEFDIDRNTTEISSETNKNTTPVKKSNRIKNNPKILSKITESLQSVKKKLKLSSETSNTQSQTAILKKNNAISETEIQKTSSTNSDNNDSNDLDSYFDTSNIENGSFEGFKLPITQIRAISDFIIVSSEDGNIYKFCWRTLELLGKFTKHTQAVIQFYIDTNGFIYSVSLDGYLKKTSYYDENFGLEMQSINLQEPLQSIDIQWNLAFIGSRWGNIFVYNIKDNKLSETLLYSVGSSIMALKATKEESRKILIVASKGNQINIIDSTSGQLLRIINVPVNYNIYSILLCGNIIYCGSNKNEILSYDFTTGQKIGTMLCGNGAISMKMFKNKQIFVGCYDGFVYVLDKNTGNQIGRFPGSGNIITALDIIGEKILTAAKDNSLKLADIPNYVLALEK